MNIYRYETDGGKDLILEYIAKLPKKQKGKAEQFELDKAIKRAKELGRELGKSFV